MQQLKLLNSKFEFLQELCSIRMLLYYKFTTKRHRRKKNKNKNYRKQKQALLYPKSTASMCRSRSHINRHQPLYTKIDYPSFYSKDERETAKPKFLSHGQANNDHKKKLLYATPKRIRAHSFTFLS